MAEWGRRPEGEPPKKLLKLSESQKDRFSYISAGEMEEICKGFVPVNTEKNTKWAMKCFNEWCSARNTKGVEECPSYLLEAQILAQLDKWIAILLLKCAAWTGIHTHLKPSTNSCLVC